MKSIRTWFLLTILSTASVTGQSSRQALSWELGYAASYDAKPSKWVSAKVPGAVQLDIARSQNYGPLAYGENWKNYLWMEDQFFTYRTRFGKIDIQPGEKLYFISGGIDYQFEIWLNNRKLWGQEGMFTPVKIDITEAISESNDLIVKLFPVPKRFAEPADRNQASSSVKPAVSYGWDWHPRLIPLGIWEETYLQKQQDSYLDDLFVQYQLTDNLSVAEINLVPEGRNLDGTPYRWVLKDREGGVRLTASGLLSQGEKIPPLRLDRIQLWWPHDQGDPYLYQSEFQLLDPSGKVVQTVSAAIGFRQVRLVMNAGAWNEPAGYPKTRSIPPIQMEINGRKIFCKGTNWVNPEIFPGIITRERYQELLDLAKQVNFNILRVWGGGIVNKESFFECCDEMGILVWQEFPLSCNNYPDDPHYLSILKQESESIIRKLRKHPSLALWCGGNELFNSWSGMTDQSLPLRLLNSQCLKLDPATPFIPTSPVMGMAHGHYVFRDAVTKEEVFQEMLRSRYSAYTEFGMPAPASVEILRTIIPQNEWWPPKPGTAWESHHAFKAWGLNTWLCQDILEDYFGEISNIEELVRLGQLVQGEGYKCIFESARRQKPYCSMALNWCYNEPWPTAANNSIVSYPAIPKPGYYEVQKACRPILASAVIEKFQWKKGEDFKTRVWMLNDSPREVRLGRVQLELVSGSDTVPVGVWNFDGLSPNENRMGPDFAVRIPTWASGLAKLRLSVEGHPEWDSEYTIQII